MWTHCRFWKTKVNMLGTHCDKVTRGGKPLLYPYQVTLFFNINLNKEEFLSKSSFLVLLRCVWKNNACSQFQKCTNKSFKRQTQKCKKNYYQHFQQKWFFSHSVSFQVEYNYFYVSLTTKGSRWRSLPTFIHQKKRVRKHLLRHIINAAWYPIVSAFLLSINWLTI